MEDVLTVILRVVTVILPCESQDLTAMECVPVPIVIRMEGTNVERGKQMLRESGLNFTTVDTMSEAAERVVALAE